MIVSWWQLCRQWSKVLTRGVGRSSDQKSAEALHTGIRHDATVLRDGRQATVDVTTLVPGDIIELRLGFQPLPDDFFIALAGLALGYLLLIELGKRAFDGAIPATSRPVRKRADDAPPPPAPPRRPPRRRRWA